MHINFDQYPLLFDINKKNGENRIWRNEFFPDHTFYVFAEEVVIEIIVYLLITNLSLYEKIMNLFEHMKT